MTGIVEASSPKGRSVAGFWHGVVDRYASADPRSLGLFRIALGSLLFADSARRYPDIEAHYANTGWLTNHFLLFRPMSDYTFSLYLTCSSPGQVKVLLALQLLVDALLIVGFRTRLMHVLAAILLASLNSRNVMIENGGWVVLTLLTVWSAFLPLGRRFSVDALLMSLHHRRETSLARLNTVLPRDTAPVVSLAVFSLVLQWTTIYAFNALQKDGLPWRDGTAVYYALHQGSVLTAFGAWLGNALSLRAIRALSFSTLAIEGLVAVLLISPLATRWTRMVAWVLACCLHLSIAATLHLGTFSWAMIVMFVALIPGEAWQSIEAWARAHRPDRILWVDADSSLAIAVCRAVKRFDVLDKVCFRAAEGHDIGRFVVTDPNSGRRMRGFSGLLALADALPLGRASVVCLRAPGISGLVKKAIRSAERKPGHWAAYFEVLPLSPPELVEPQLRSSPAAESLRRFWSRMGEVTVLVLLVCCGSQVLLENQLVPVALKPTHRPAWMSAVVIYPRLFQGWSMFAPAPPLDDVAIVVDGRTRDGRHFDPLTGGEPSFAVSTRTDRSRNCEWYYFERRLSDARFRNYLPGVRDFLKNHHLITQRPADELVAFDVWSVSEAIVLPGTPKPPTVRSKILSYGGVRD